MDALLRAHFTLGLDGRVTLVDGRSSHFGRDRDLRLDVGRTPMMLLAVLAVSPPSVGGRRRGGGDGRVAVRGRVVDAQTGEAIAKATVTVPALQIEAATDGAGTLHLRRPCRRGDVELVVTTIGYGLARKTVRVGASRHRGRDPRRPGGAQAVGGGPRGGAALRPRRTSAAPAAHTLRGVELRNLGGVITDDPLRSVQSLPGVATGDDFYASFATRGSGFSSVGFYLDGVLMSAPFHTIRDVNDAYSLTILNGDVVRVGLAARAAARPRATATARAPSSTSTPARATATSSRAAPAWAPPASTARSKARSAAGKKASWLAVGAQELSRLRARPARRRSRAP